jgi:hypothetical protein
MGEMADFALEHEMFPDVMHDQVHGYDSGDGPPEDPEPCFGSDSKAMLERPCIVVDDEDLTPDIPIHEDDYWVRFGDPIQSSSFTGDYAGKYLFFSADKSLLMDIAETEIIEHGFECAKVSQEPRNADYVLCLYWEASDRSAELACRYTGRPHVKYRWWKSNADTRKGKYSNQHKRRRR